MITYEYDLDVTPGGTPVCVNLSQYDRDFELRFRLYSREGYLDIKSGTTVSIRGTKKDNRGYSAVATIDGNVVTVTGNVQMTAVAGRQNFELTLLSGGKELNTANFFLCVERAAMDKDTVRSESVIKEFEDVSGMAERIMDDVKNARESLERMEKDVSTSVSTAALKADAAAKSAATASAKAAEASSSASVASAKASAASGSAAEADGYATEAESYAHGGTGMRTNEDVDNAKYYYEQAKRISQGLDGTLLPMGTVTFSQLESQTKVPGYMYNISDAFTTDSSFKEGAGFLYPSGTNVYRTADGFWDCLAGTSVVSVNGQTGAVTITPASIGAIDDETQIQFEESNTLANIESGENIPTIFGKIKKMMGSLLIGAGSTLLGQNLTAARALVSDVNGKVGVSTITAAELGYLAGLKKNAQTQFDELNGNLSGKANSNHAHYYAGSTSAGGSADSAVKLDSNAGSATQPVFFKDGKPSACTYSLGKSVPANAVFTDTNTWRGIQNNLTSTSTTDALSAAQGKTLNENKARVVKNTWGTSIKVTVPHGLVLRDAVSVHLVWVAGGAGSYSVNHKVVSGSDDLDFAVNATTGEATITVKSGNNAGITYFGM